VNFAEVEKIAAAILYEGYILYPYRASSIKNRQRWNFGTLYPRIYAEAQRPPEPFRLVAECVAEAGPENACLDLKIQFLQLLRQQKEASSASDGMHGLSDPSLEWDEAIERCTICTLQLDELLEQPLARSFAVQAAATVPEGRRPADLQIELRAEVSALPDGARKIHIEIENDNPLPSGADATREEALPLSFVSAHVLLGIERGNFVSLLDPPESYREAVASCQNVGVFPVLAGNEPDRSMMLCSPIILYDYPKIAPESEGDFFDGTEMDEMLALRVLTLSDAEKEEMRHGDPLARRILERTESLTAENMIKAHGVIRGMREIRGGTS